MHERIGRDWIKQLIVAGALVGTALSAPKAFADTWVTGGVSNRIDGSSANTRVGIGITGTPNAGLEVQNNNSGVEGIRIIQNQTTGAPAIARFRQGANERMILTNVGNLGIGTTSPSEKLHVSGNVFVTGFVNADGGLRVKTSWALEVPDYVFDQTKYKLMSLPEVERFVRREHHLPEIPSADEIKKDGIDVAQMNMLLLKKVEELTLHVIEQDKRIRELAAKVN
jgi:hypothetical protein